METPAFTVNVERQASDDKSDTAGRALTAVTVFTYACKELARGASLINHARSWFYRFGR